MPESPALRICGPKSVTYHWPVIHFQQLSVHRPVYSNCIDELKVVCRCASGISFILKDMFWVFFLLHRFSEGGIQIHKNLSSQDFHELHSDSAALPFFPHFQLVFIASFLLSPGCPPPWLLVCALPSILRQLGFLLTWPHSPAPPPSGQHFISHFSLWLLL